nr:PxxKW family cysteine-rich protein [Deltaproteobacteria bacterium]
MLCQTLKKGVDCMFMKKTGCGYNGGKCYTVTAECEGCTRIVEYETGKFCSIYAEPQLKWKNGSCNFATHVKKEDTTQKKALNALKASKRKAAGKM